MKVYCRHCKNFTNHRVVAEETKSHDRDYDDPWGEIHRFSQCAGCDFYSYSIESWTINDWNSYTNEYDTSWKIYPSEAVEPDSLFDDRQLPSHVMSIYKEVQAAASAQLNILAAIGLRTLIEAICLDRNIQGPNLAARIEGLAEQGVLSRRDAGILHAHRFIGNTATHEIKPAKPEDVSTALEIAEHIMKSIYVLPALHERIRPASEP